MCQFTAKCWTPSAYHTAQHLEASHSINSCGMWRLVICKDWGANDLIMFCKPSEPSNWRIKVVIWSLGLSCLLISWFRWFVPDAAVRSAFLLCCFLGRAWEFQIRYKAMGTGAIIANWQHTENAVMGVGWARFFPVPYFLILRCQQLQPFTVSHSFLEQQKQKQHGYVKCTGLLKGLLISCREQSHLKCCWWNCWVFQPFGKAII